jgi:hypothetical protein
MKFAITNLVLLFLITTAHGQIAPSDNLRPSGIESIIKESGWEIPGLLQSQVLNSKDMVPEGSSMKGISVHVTTFKPKRELITTVPIFNLKNDGKVLVLGQRQGEVNLIFKCELRGRAFAYIVQLVEIFSDAQNRRTGYGDIFGVRYYDNDGDGVLESYEQGEGYIKDLRVPDWTSKRK